MLKFPNTNQNILSCNNVLLDYFMYLLGEKL